MLNKVGAKNVFVNYVVFGEVLDKKFYSQDTLTVAKSLLGKVLHIVDKSTNTHIAGIIVETEAYLHDDPASHSFRGKTKRNEAMFLEAGSCYVYFIYGNHYCVNVVTNSAGIGEAVLIRAIQPISGMQTMKRRRKTDVLQNLCSGPGKLAQAYAIDKKYNGANFIDGPIFIHNGITVDDTSIVTTKRVGITGGEHLPHRFYIKHNTFVSQ